MTARIARKAELKNAFVMGILTSLTISIPLILYKFTFDWYQTVLFVLAMPFALLGGYLKIVTYKPDIEITISEEERKRIKKKKILIGICATLGVIIALVVAARFFIYNYLPKLIFTVPTDLKTPAIVKGSGLFSKSIFANIILRDSQLGDITDIVYLKIPQGSEIGIAGTDGALFLDKNLAVKSMVHFSIKSQHVDVIRMKGNDNYAFLDRRHWECSDCCSSSLINLHGKTLWTYTTKSAIDDMAAGDLEGNETMEFVVGFNGRGGIHLLDMNGKKKWEKPDANVWHVEFADTNVDGKLEIVHSNAANQITLRDKQGNIIRQKRLLHHFTDFSITQWPDKKGKKYVLFSDNDKIWLIDFAGNDIAKFDAPHSHTLGHARGIPLKIRSDKPEYFAILVNFRHWERSCLYIYNSSQELVYQEILSDPCASIAVLPVDNSAAETLLVGCSGKVWQYKTLRYN